MRKEAGSGKKRKEGNKGIKTLGIRKKGKEGKEGIQKGGRYGDRKIKRRGKKKRKGKKKPGMWEK